MESVRAVYRFCKYVAHRVVAPLRSDETLSQFTLAIPEAQTTTVDSVQGWQRRPPAFLECPGCGSEILQKRALDTIDCPDCWRSYREDEFADMELVAMYCPRCETPMEHGIRHPLLYDIPEWATCPDCQYHWDLDHWF